MKNNSVTKYLSVFLALVFIVAFLPSGVLASPEPNYLTFTAEEAGSSITFGFVNGLDPEYSLNGGKWSSIENGATITLKNIGDSVSLRGTDVRFGEADDCHF